MASNSSKSVYLDKNQYSKVYYLETTTIFHHWYSNVWYFFNVLDIINCDVDDDCHENATCTDANGNYSCACLEGFTGDGLNCTGETEIFLHVITWTDLGGRWGTNFPI